MPKLWPYTRSGATDQATKLQSLWTADPPYGDILKDHGPSGYHGNLIGFSGQTSTSGWTKDNTGRSALAYDGTNDTVLLGNVFNFERTDIWSVAGWICPNVTRSGGDTNYAIISKLQSGAPFAGWELSLEYNNANAASKTVLSCLLCNTFSSSALQVIGQTDLANGVWVHIAFVYLGTSAPTGVQFFVNGVQETNATLVNALTTSIISSAPLYIGSRNNAALFQKGQIGELRLYNKAFSVAQIREMIRDRDAVRYKPAPRPVIVAVPSTFDVTTIRRVFPNPIDYVQQRIDQAYGRRMPPSLFGPPITPPTWAIEDMKATRPDQTTTRIDPKLPGSVSRFSPASVTSKAGPGPAPGPPSTLPFIPSVPPPDPDASVRTRKQQQAVAEILNSLQRQGELVKTDNADRTWVLGYQASDIQAFTPGGIPTTVHDALDLAFSEINDNAAQIEAVAANATTGGNSSGGGSVSFGTVAVRPAAGNNGTLYIATDFPLAYIDNGVTWGAFGPLYPLTSPLTTGWTEHNFSTSSGTTTRTVKADGSAFLYDVGTSGEHIRMVYRTVPSKPYTVEIAFLPVMVSGGGSNYSAAGIMLRASGSDKRYGFGFGHGAGVPSSDIWHWGSGGDTSATDHLASTARLPHLGIVFLRISETSTTRDFDWSQDGQNWINFFHESSGNVNMTADQIGYYVNLIGGSYVGMTVLHWKQT